MTAIPTFSDEVLSMGKDAYESRPNSGVRIYNVTGRTDATIMFLNNPWDSPTDWINYREIRAFNGLRTGHKLPGGLAAFPAVDRKEGVSPQTGRPIMLTVTDPLLDLIQPGQYDKDGRVRPAAVKTINAIFLGGRMGEKKSEYEPQPGQHILIKLSRRLGEQLVDKFNERRDENPNFDATLNAWNLSVQGEGVNSNIVLSKNNDVQPPADDITSYDIPTVLAGMRECVEEAIGDINETMRMGSTIQEPPTVEDPFADNGDEVVESLEQAIANVDQAGLLTSDPFDGLSDARLKKLLVDAGVAVPRGATREALVNLAHTAGWADASDIAS